MARGRRGLPPKDPGASFSDIQPDPSHIGGVAEAPFVRLPDPSILFSNRAARLGALANDHVLAPYFHFLAAIVAAQAACVAAFPRPAPLDPALVSSRIKNGFPPISADEVRKSEDFSGTLAWLLDHLAAGGTKMPDEARAAIDALRAMAEPERVAFAGEIFEGVLPADRVAESLFLAAALQVHLSRLSAQLDAASITPPAPDSLPAGICPVCGGAPVASLVVGWTQASKARYCACALCGTLWNHVRVKCTACGATQGIVYYTVADGPTSIGLEACGACRCYIKHMRQHADPALDPVADDVASYALDVLAREREFRKAGFNPLFLTG
jgi:FdhE protein